MFGWWIRRINGEMISGVTSIFYMEIWTAVKKTWPSLSPGSRGPSAGWSFVTHGELLPGRGLQPGQGAGRVWAERRWAAAVSRTRPGAEPWEIKFRSGCGLEALMQPTSKSDNQLPPSEFEQHSQVVIEGMRRGNRTNWTIHLPEDCGKLCYQSKTKGWSLSPLTLAANNNSRLYLCLF